MDAQKKFIKIRTTDGWHILNTEHFSEVEWLPSRTSIHLRMLNGTSHIISGKQADKVMQYIVTH